MFAKSLIVAATLALTSEAVKIKTGLAANALAGVNIQALSKAELSALLTATAEEYGSYCHNHAKSYLSEEERQARHQKWLEQQAYNQTHNAAEGSSATFGDNQFSDMSEEEKSKANGTKEPKNDEHHEEMLLARVGGNRFKVKMSTEQYQSLYDTKWANKQEKGWDCQKFDDWFNNKDEKFMSKKENKQRNKMTNRAKDPMSADEFDAYWMRIMQDRTVAQSSIVRCEDDGEHHDDDDHEEEEQDDEQDEEQEQDDNTDGQCNPANDTFVWGDNVVVPIKNQGQCGSCYSFSAMTVLESALAIQSGNQVMAFSEQQIVDCQNNYANCYGCNGGWPVSMHESSRQHAIATEASYPYTGNEASCNLPTNSSEWVSAEDVYYIQGTAEAVKEALCVGPITLTVRANGPFMSYSGGVMTSADCPYNNDLDHAVAAIGWTVMEGQEVLIVRNSWGTWWGDEGYIYMAMDDGNNGQGPCGIFAYPSSATVNMGNFA